MINIIALLFLILSTPGYGAEKTGEENPKHRTRSLSPTSETEGRLILLENRVEDLEREVQELKRKSYISH